MPDALARLAGLVGVRGLTGEEGPVMQAAAALGRELELAVEATPDGLIVRTRVDQPGPTLCFCSHLDTVPAGEGWSSPPYEGVIRHEAVYGRGAVDARASCLAILLTMAHVAAAPAAGGRVIGLLSLAEEGLAPSLPRLLDRAGEIHAAVVGEPTNLNIAVAQRGLLVLELGATGMPGHAARVAGPNAIYRLADDLRALRGLALPRLHPTLGPVRITPTRLNAGVADNATPALATALLDVRTTPAYSTPEIIAAIQETVSAAVRVVADQWIPCETPVEHPLVQLARQTAPEAKIYASDATSDWVFLAARGVPAIKLGPGDPRFSHAPDERITRDELERGVAAYIRLADCWRANDERRRPPSRPDEKGE